MGTSQNRAERLLALMDVLRDGQLHRAEDLAATLGVSLRTVYRDMKTLMASGVAVEGARGTGYRAQTALTLPPLNLTETELEALHIGLAVVGTGMEGELRAAAESLSAKIDAVLPEEAGGVVQGFGFASYPFDLSARALRHLEPLRTAIRAKQKLRLVTQDGARDVRPLKLRYWGRVWVLAVWDETGNAFAEQRVDQITEITPLPGLFVEEPGKSLRDFEAQL
ncbi:helix-turn-helix transcriptional regulator [Shimia sp. MMG029]|uniref:helix-turn-helix transcriptional regulator n=1 Tax=Shimia sp. MMG029 TaxID=3021978 RepID=UPI0022FF3A78|nr:HTH domain-containing protein [Shimia sp. MMG029]MDA5557883.1 HTH domain-containing protein [Shimia sp. MMG029]